ncbi:phage head-tail adapter protein [Streptococcus dysgalactiae]|uniref:Phage head-tail adapter protein n=1 Tax=Streptococcus dysgalactiae TaxID=1334 RepID=A0AAE9UNJ9_STRDY|nr:phage head-tail adapter protein [Streptococcus dysgalactiae]QGH04845.1 phage head-tail adapter protein [Streptococcus dysgalactiae subsp. dysgalactiae]WAI93944.1 phage head-tail adapter protein [Streptococcus dysgalactiae]WCE86576.1 phage head-tail adapter protein [Streptococcus dysgalactiae]WCN26571.1 phage head-tail adapter protein [Streptococcus dysgalactiae]
MINGKSLKKQKTGNGQLNTVIKFYTSTTDDTLDGRDTALKLAYTTMGEVYNPSSKDIEIAMSRKVEAKMTLKIRDPLQDYYPENDHIVKIFDNRVTDDLGVIDVRPDFTDRHFLIVVVGG